MAAVAREAAATSMRQYVGIRNRGSLRRGTGTLSTERTSHLLYGTKEELLYKEKEEDEMNRGIRCHIFSRLVKRRSIKEVYNKGR